MRVKQRLAQDAAVLGHAESNPLLLASTPRAQTGSLPVPYDRPAKRETRVHVDLIRFRPLKT